MSSVIINSIDNDEMISKPSLLIKRIKKWVEARKPEVVNYTVLKNSDYMIEIKIDYKIKRKI